MYSRLRWLPTQCWWPYDYRSWGSSFWDCLRHDEFWPSLNDPDYDRNAEFRVTLPLPWEYCLY